MDIGEAIKEQLALNEKTKKRNKKGNFSWVVKSGARKK